MPERLDKLDCWVPFDKNAVKNGCASCGYSIRRGQSWSHCENLKRSCAQRCLDVFHGETVDHTKALTRLMEKGDEERGIEANTVRATSTATNRRYYERHRAKILKQKREYMRSRRKKARQAAA